MSGKSQGKAKLTEAAQDDPRRARTRSALREAFLEMALQRKWSEIRIGEIIDRAGVGRSTFYEHFNNKSDLLRDGLSGPFAALADCVAVSGDEAALADTLAHFWLHRRVGVAMLSGAPRRVATQLLVELLADRLRRSGRASPASGLPERLTAAYFAAAQIEVLADWLGGKVASTASALAEALIAFARPIRRG